MNKLLVLIVILCIFLSCDKTKHSSESNDKSGTESDLKKFAGTFIVLPGWKLRIISRHNKLKIKAGNQIYRVLKREKPYYFEYESLDAYIHFFEQNNKVDSLVLTQVASKKYSNDAKNKYVGTYKTKNNFEFHITRDKNQYYAQSEGTPKYAIYKNESGQFKYKVNDSFYTFEFVDSTQMAYLKLHEPAKRQYKPRQINRNEITLELNEIKEKVGSYIISDRLKMEITLENEQLYAQLTDEGKFKIYPSASNKFFFKVMNGEIEFTYNENGQISGLMLFRLDEFLPAKKK